MLPLELSADACSLRPGEVRRVVSIELRDRRRRQARGAARAPRADPQPRAAELRRGARGAGRAGSTTRTAICSRAPTRWRAICARGATPAAPSRSRRASSRSTVADGRVVDARWDEEPRAHALVEELMLLANEAVGGLLARARRPALYRVHEHPKHEALLALADRLQALGLPVAPLPERAERPAGVASPSRARPSCSSPIVRERPAAREAFGALLLRTLQLARYDPVNSGPRRARLAGLRALHVADPALPRHRRAPRRCARSRASARMRRRRATCPRSRCAARAASARRPMPSAAPMRSAWPSCCRSGCARDGWQQTFDGVVTGLIGAGLFVRFGDVFEGFLPARRLDARERFDVDEHGVALVGRSLGPAHPARRRALVRRDRRRPAARARDARHRARARRAARARTRPVKTHDAAAPAEAGRGAGAGRRKRASRLRGWPKANARSRATARRGTSTTSSSASRPASRSRAPRSSRCAPARSRCARRTRQERGGELWLVGATIEPYEQGNRANHEPTRDRKLLAHKHEIEELATRVAEKGLTLIPLRLYFKDGRVKAEIALARGKEGIDKRRALAERDVRREIDREMKTRFRG